MTEAKIIVPALCLSKADRLGLCKRLAKVFGGYTVVQGAGCWVDGKGEAIHEPVAVYTVAITEGATDSVKLEMSRKLHLLACWAAFAGHQDCVYTCDFSGNVKLVSPRMTFEAVA